MNAIAIPAPSRSQDAASAQPEPPPAVPGARPVDIMLVDDDIHTSYSVWALLRWRPGIRVAAAFAPSEEASGVIAATRPDVCLVAAALGWDFIRGLTRQPDAPPVLVYANDRGPELDVSAALAGAEGVVWRYEDPAELTKTIQAIADRRKHGGTS